MPARRDTPPMKAPQIAVHPDGGEVICYDPEQIEQHRVGTTPDGKPMLRPVDQSTPRQPGEAVPITAWPY